MSSTDPKPPGDQPTQHDALAQTHSPEAQAHRSDALTPNADAQAREDDALAPMSAQEQEELALIEYRKSRRNLLGKLRISQVLTFSGILGYLWIGVAGTLFTLPDIIYPMVGIPSFIMITAASAANYMILRILQRQRPRQQRGPDHVLALYALASFAFVISPLLWIGPLGIGPEAISIVAFVLYAICNVFSLGLNLKNRDALQKLPHHDPDPPRSLPA